MITGKNVLLLCKESFSFPLYFIAEHLNEAGNNVGALFVNPIESYYGKSQFNENTYYKFKEQLPFVKLYDLSMLCEEFNNTYSEPINDFTFLNDLEDRYTYYKNLNMQLVASQLASRQYHSRFYFRKSTFIQDRRYLSLGYEKVLQIFKEFKPDMILDLDDGELLRTIINEVSHVNKIPYITIDYPRYEEYKIPTYCMGLKVDSFFKNEYCKQYSKSSNLLKAEYDYVRKFRTQATIMSSEFKGTITSQYKPSSIFHVAKYIYGKGLYFLKHYIKSGMYKKTKKNILYDNVLLHFIFYVIVEIKKQYLYRRNIYFSSPKEGEQYIYMPLHLIPESTTLVKAPLYINELTIIEQVSKCMPVGWKLYVKEHQAMLGERNFKFYRQINSIPNVRLVQFNYFHDPKPWITNSEGVITITGTAAYEAAMLGKSALVFGDVPFVLIEGVKKVNSFEELPFLLKSLASKENIHSCAAYIAAVKAAGIKLNIKNMMREGESILRGDKDMSYEYKNEIYELSKFYENAFNSYKSE